ncbi:MAG: DUF429 domain-containing protein, partial [Candidatus Competibacterales bacterium]
MVSTRSSGSCSSGPFVGVDGCRGGWCTAAVNDVGRWEVAWYPQFAAVVAAYPKGVLLVDIPIGLSAGPPRQCDVEARRRLKPQPHASVFTPPCPPAMQAPQQPTATRRHRHCTGKGLSIQAWHLTAAIRAVDD